MHMAKITQTALNKLLYAGVHEPIKEYHSISKCLGFIYNGISKQTCGKKTNN